MDDRLSYEDYVRLFKAQKDGTYKVWGETFQAIEIQQAVDAYITADAVGLFDLPPNFAGGVLTMEKDHGATGKKLLMTFCFPTSVSFLQYFTEKDNRIIVLVNERIRREKENLPLIDEDETKEAQ